MSDMIEMEILDIVEKGRIEADRKEFEGFKSEFGDATTKYPMQLEDPERLDLAIVYSGIRHNRDAQVAAERLARNYLRINDFDSAQKVFDKMGYTPKQVIRNLDDLYTFTGNDEYLEMKDFYRANVFAGEREGIFGNYVTAMKELGEELSELNYDIMKFKEEYHKGSMDHDEVNMGWERLTNRGEDLDFKVRTVKDNYKGRTSELEKYFGMHRERKPKKGLFKRIFGNRKKR